jgi:hypothetical protein
MRWRFFGSRGRPKVALRKAGAVSDAESMHSTSCSRFDISGWRDRGLYPLGRGAEARAANRGRA